MNAIQSGAGLIAAERQRQIEGEGWNWTHDDEHDKGELALAAACYSVPPDVRGSILGQTVPPQHWPWDIEWWKPTPDDRIRELTKAGALIAAEIDRLLRAEENLDAEDGSCHDWRTLI